MKKLILFCSVCAAVSALSAQAADVKAIYEKECAKCHGTDGKGDTKMGKKLNVKDYTSAKVQDEMKDDKAFKSVKEGVKEGESTKMKAFGESLSDDDIKGLVKYVRAFKK